MSFEQFAVHGQERQLRYLQGLADATRRSPDELFEVMQLVRTARLPLLRLRFRGRLDVDLTMGDDVEGGGAECDAAIRALLAAAPDGGAHRFVRVIKAFAKGRGLVDAYGGYLNSLSWTCLAICFLQGERCLPPCRELLPLPQGGGGGRPAEGTAGCGASPAAERGGVEAATRPPPTRVTPPPKRRRGCFWPVQLTGALFARFFAFMERCGDWQYRISVHDHHGARRGAHRAAGRQ